MKQLQNSLNQLFGYRYPGPHATFVSRIQDSLQRQDRAALAKARKLAKNHGIDIEKEDSDAFWVTYAPVIDTDKDPLEGNHFCSTGTEVLQSVAAYVDFINTQAA